MMKAYLAHAHPTKQCNELTLSGLWVKLTPRSCQREEKWKEFKIGQVSYRDKY